MAVYLSGFVIVSVVLASVGAQDSNAVSNAAGVAALPFVAAADTAINLLGGFNHGSSAANAAQTATSGAAGGGGGGVGGVAGDGSGGIAGGGTGGGTGGGYPSFPGFNPEGGQHKSPYALSGVLVIPYPFSASNYPSAYFYSNAYFH